MALVLNKSEKFEVNKEDIIKMVNSEADRYVKYVLIHNETELIFMKSFLYIENLLLKINQNLFSMKDDTSFAVLFHNYKKIEGVENKYFIEIKFVKEIRDKISHEIEYDLTKDKDFLEEFNLNGIKNNDERKAKIAMYFSNIIHGILFVKVGMELFDNFIIYKK